MLPEERMRAPVARESESQCGGYIEYAPASLTKLEIVGGEQEQEQRVYAEGDYVFINIGAQQGWVTVGQEFSVIRPRGRFTSAFTKKKGTLGIYTQEIARLRVTEIKDKVSVAVVTRSCETVLLGDLLRAVPRPPAELTGDAQVAVEKSMNAPLDRFADPSGKQQGRIVLARDGREMVSRDQVV
ncbi:MAG: hypothetical protein ACRD68_18550, partial [Pyrinomonadaceae bacterium]